MKTPRAFLSITAVLFAAQPAPTCWPAPESIDNMNTSRVGRLGLSDAEEDAIVSFMQTLTDGIMPIN